MPIIHARNLSKSYTLIRENDTTVLHGVSIDIEAEEFVAIVGPSGAGKSTLLHILGSLDSADSGSVELDIRQSKCTLANLSAAELAKFRNEEVGFIFQFHQLLPEFTALENVMMPLLIAGRSFRDARESATELLSEVGLKERMEHKPQELSGGEQQRVAIARALVNTPTILFADEPTGNLDSANTDAILDLLREIRGRRSLTMVIATHSADVAAAAQRIVYMRDGRIVSAPSTPSSSTTHRAGSEGGSSAIV